MQHHHHHMCMYIHPPPDRVSSSLKARMETEELSYANISELHKVVDGIAQVVNKRLIHLISEQYQLMTHLRVSK
jgi:hypothetical protein